MQLYTYFRSSAAYRVRIALNLKGVAYTPEIVNLLKDENLDESYKAINAQQLVPTLVDHQGVLTQSIAILEYLEERHPLPALLPGDLYERSLARSYALQIGCDIHPLNNRRVLKYLENPLKLTPEQRQEWMHHWMKTGFSALEAQVLQTAGKFMVGSVITFADICLIPQIYSALRFNVEMMAFPRLMEIYSRCMELAEFQKTAPENQPDWVG